MKLHREIGIQEPEILLPNNTIDHQKWSVIACDQFTSQPEYWQGVDHFVGDSPSTLRMILPEVYLDTPKERDLIQSTQATMKAYIETGILVPHEGFILVERSIGGKTRTGLMAALDLEHYDFTAGSQTLIRATEGTILERLPPRIRIRKDALLELPHILVLIDDPERSVIEPLAARKDAYRKAYDFDLMMNSGHLTGHQVDDVGARMAVESLRKLADPDAFQQRYHTSKDKGVLLFAIGDGNHSLATAKSIWESVKATVGMEHPARYALVELENLHDPALDFEPIHRVLFEVQSDLIAALEAHFGNHYRLDPIKTMDEVIARVKSQAGQEQSVGVTSTDGFSILTFTQPASNLAVGSLQGFLDAWLQSGQAGRIDYVHGDDIVAKLGTQPGNLGFFLPAMAKNDLFKTVIVDGVLPRKTFSMGEAHEKRFYMECRQIR